MKVEPFIDVNHFNLCYYDFVVEKNKPKQLVDEVLSRSCHVHFFKLKRCRYKEYRVDIVISFFTKIYKDI